jgi:hypothetical protein
LSLSSRSARAVLLCFTAITDEGTCLGSLGEGEKQVAVWGREVLKDEFMMCRKGRAEQDIGEEHDA